jgi:hypothetical protein
MLGGHRREDCREYVGVSWKTIGYLERARFHVRGMDGQALDNNDLPDFVEGAHDGPDKSLGQLGAIRILRHSCEWCANLARQRRRAGFDDDHRRVGQPEQAWKSLNTSIELRGRRG